MSGAAHRCISHSHLCWLLARNRKRGGAIRITNGIKASNIAWPKVASSILQSWIRVKWMTRASFLAIAFGCFRFLVWVEAWKSANAISTWTNKPTTTKVFVATQRRVGARGQRARQTDTISCGQLCGSPQNESFYCGAGAHIHRRQIVPWIFSRSSEIYEMTMSWHVYGNGIGSYYPNRIHRNAQSASNANAKTCSGL